MRLPRPCCVFILGAALARAASFDARVDELFRPLQAEMIALSPEGQRIAYTVPNGRELSLVVMNIEAPGAKRRINVEREREPASAEPPPPLQLRILRWATNTRLVYAPPERIVPLPPVADRSGRLMPNPDGPIIVSPIFVVDADGKQHGTLVDARDFQETPADARKSLGDLLRTTKELQATRHEPVRWRMPHLDVLGFLPRDRDQLVIRTHGAYSPATQRLVDIRSGSVREFGGEWPIPPDESQVFDGYRLRIVGERRRDGRPATVWRDEELGRVQRELETKFSRRVVEILDWSETRSRVLFRVTGGSDPGRIFVFQRPEDLVLELFPRAPWLTAARLHETRFFALAARDGAHLSGYVTWPGKPRVSPPPLLVVFPSGIAGEVLSAFDPEANAFAELGFVVARLNRRRVTRLISGDSDALQSGDDRVAVNDARTVVEWLAAQNAHRPFDPKRVAALGRVSGGYLAVRALQLEPAVFRSAVAIDAPMEPGRSADGKKRSVPEHAEILTHPVLLLVEPGRGAAVDTAAAGLPGKSDAFGRAAVHYVELDSGFPAHAESRAAVYRKIDDFLNLHLPPSSAPDGSIR